MVSGLKRNKIIGLAIDSLIVFLLSSELKAQFDLVWSNTSRHSYLECLVLAVIEVWHIFAILQD